MTANTMSKEESIYWIQKGNTLRTLWDSEDVFSRAISSAVAYIKMLEMAEKRIANLENELESYESEIIPAYARKIRELDSMLKAKYRDHSYDPIKILDGWVVRCDEDERNGNTIRMEYSEMRAFYQLMKELYIRFRSDSEEVSK